jgi:hypothetical protein
MSAGDDSRLKKWTTDIKADIQSSLEAGADGM